MFIPMLPTGERSSHPLRWIHALVVTLGQVGYGLGMLLFALSAVSATTTSIDDLPLSSCNEERRTE